MRAHRTAVRQSVSYLLLTYAVTLLIVMLLGDAPLAPTAAAFVPVLALAAITPVWRRDVWRGLGLTRAGVALWPVAVALPAAVAMIAYLAAAAFGVVRIELHPTLRTVASVAGWVAIGALLVMAEEIGWRGFLYPRLRSLLGSGRRSAVATGFLHALVHLPLILLTTSYDAEGNRWVIAPMATVTITGAGVMYAWLRTRSDSLWPAALAHSAGNTLIGLVAGAAASSPATLAQIGGEGGVATALAVTAVAAFLLARSGDWRTDPRALPAGERVEPTAVSRRAARP
jgi:membrane protease YdiL (CAAX protease family)